MQQAFPRQADDSPRSPTFAEIAYEELTKGYPPAGGAYTKLVRVNTSHGQFALAVNDEYKSSFPLTLDNSLQQRAFKSHRELLR